MNRCCTIDNLDQATADGTLASEVNVFVCRTCNLQYSFCYHHRADFNACWSYVHMALNRQGKGLPIFTSDDLRTKEIVASR